MDTINFLFPPSIEVNTSINVKDNHRPKEENSLHKALAEKTERFPKIPKDFRFALESIKYPKEYRTVMDWIKVLLSLVVILLYIPLVFMGANVFFPEYTGSDSYYYAYKECGITKGEIYEQNSTCIEEQQAEQKAYEDAKAKYDGNKYIFIVLLNLIVLLIALFITLDESVSIGLFLASILTTFFSTWTYFSTQSKIGFAILFIIFFVTIYFITKKRNVFQFKEHKK